MALGESTTKMSKDQRAVIMLAFEDLGGLPRLVQWANDPTNPQNLSTFYTQIWTKVIPKEVVAKIDTNQRLSVTWDCDTESVVDMTTEDGISIAELVEENEED